MTNKYNGFASEKQYLEAFEKFKRIQEANDCMDRETIALYKVDNDYLEFVIDNFTIVVWSSAGIEINVKAGTTLVDTGIVSVAAALMEDSYNGEFDEYYQED